MYSYDVSIYNIHNQLGWIDMIQLGKADRTQFRRKPSGAVWLGPIAPGPKDWAKSCAKDGCHSDMTRLRMGVKLIARYCQWLIGGHIEKKLQVGGTSYLMFKQRANCKEIWNLERSWEMEPFSFHPHMRSSCPLKDTQILSNWRIGTSQIP